MKRVANCFVCQKLAIEIAHDLMDFDKDLTFGAVGERDRLDVRIRLIPRLPSAQVAQGTSLRAK